jgi:exopolyphosphatase / guanosine-5'-triphosphate,3'-diphosphate pyrophosphatase
MSLLASIDVGSHTLRLLIGKIEGNKLIDVFSDRIITRLGYKVDQTGKLQDENIEISLSGLKKFSTIISQYEVRHVKAVATSAVREASNSEIFLKRAYDETGISVEMIPGLKEAELTLRGILNSLPEYDSPPPPLFPDGRRGQRDRHPMFIVDIGGGSTEWILYRDQDHFDMGSIPIGLIKLGRNFTKTGPISEDELKYFESIIIPVVEDCKNKTRNLMTSHTRFIGTAGTFTSIASMDLGLLAYSREKIHLHTIRLPNLQALGNRLAALSLKNRKKIKGLEPERADLIIPGIQFTIMIMKSLGFHELIISDYGLIEGALFDIEKNISETGKS